MYISNVKIINYRNFKNFEIELKQFTLVIGENNIGKTNLLNAIGLIFSQDITFYKKRMLEIDDINYEVLKKFKKDVSVWNGEDKLDFPNVIVEIILTGFNDNSDQEAVVSDWFIDATFTKAKLTYHFGFRGDINKWATDNKGKDVNEIIVPIDKCEYSIYGGLDQTKRIDFYFLKMLKMEILDALRDSQKELIANNDSKLLFKILNNRDKSNFLEIKDQLEQLNKKVGENSELEKVKSEISTLLKKFSLEQIEGQNKIDFKFSSLEHTEILKKLAIQYGDNPISIVRNGLGRNNLLFISIVLSHLTSDAIKAQNVFFRIVGLEEPEAHLHPHLQEHLAKNIESQSNNEMQIILTSHSTHITSKLDLENTVVLYRKKTTNEITSHYILDGFENIKANGNIQNNAKSKQHKRYLSRYLDATKSTLLFGRKMILVEGVSEQILIPKFFEIYCLRKDSDQTLESIGCTVVNVHGVAFKHFLELVQNSSTKVENFFIKCLVLTDSDSGTETADRAKKLQAKYLETSQVEIQISNTETFEKDTIEINKSNEAKKILLNAVEKTRPKKGKEYKAQNEEKDIITESFFELIDEFKADFATDLFDVLKDRHKNFNIPKYIEDGFDFLIKKEQ